uniref:protein O-GlcNAc transferase n=1 Tax=Palpitomonas bilix TaxID=652834 RepID=A0A7S3G2K9_9EUKA|mmetsp:Transcript_20165/g.51477  ORF Transcript_20165/g.51477 Transcript_20165/m.51477 type:complete len:568 (+) Transcript_20165:200-1903(+)
MGKLIVLVIALFFLSTCPLLADAKAKRGGKRGGGRGGGGGIGGSKGGRGGCETAKAKTYAGYVDAGNHLFQSGDMVKAGECYEQAALASPNDGLGWSNLGLTQMYRGDFDAAIVNMQKSIRLEPKNGRFHFVLGEAFSRSGNTQRAISSLETSIALDKNNPDAYLSLGNARMTEKRYSEALGAYEQALRLRETMEARVNLAKLRLQHGQIEAGMEDFKKAQRHAPNSPFVFAEMGEGLRSVGHIQQAVPYLQKAIESPVQTELDMRGKAKAHYGLAELAAREEKHSLALQHCAEAKKIDPKLAEVRMTEGVVLWHAGRLVEAERALREGTMLAPNMAEMHANHGLVLSELSQTKEAMDALNKAIKAKPTLAEAYKAKADILKGAMKYPEAIRQYQAALKIRPTYNEALNDLVHAQQHVCDWDVYEANFKAVHEGLKREKEGGNYPLWVKPFHALVYPLSLPDTLFVSESYARRAMGRVRYQVQTPFSLSWGLTPTSTGSIRIGYVSSNMGDHSLSHLMQNVFNMHRRVGSDVDVWRGPAIEVYCYALNPSDGSNYRKTVEAGCDRFF